MIRALLHKMVSSFESKYDYDARYMHEINDVSTSAATRLMLFSTMTGFKGANKAVWGGAALAATLYGDCGPCAQLMIDRLLEEGLDQHELKACIEHDWLDANEVGLGFRFAHSVLNNTSDIDALRSDIRARFGEEVVIAASFATVSYPVYPLLKRALGSAESCQSLTVGEYQGLKPTIHL